MDQQTEKLQDSEKKVSQKSWSARKKRAILAVIAAALALLVIPVFAWLYMQRSMGNDNKSKHAVCLTDRSRRCQTDPAARASNIDVSASKSKDVVFCVYSESHPKAMICSWRIPQISGLLMKSIQPHWQTQMHPQTWLSVWGKSIRRVLHFPADI